MTTTGLLGRFVLTLQRPFVGCFPSSLSFFVVFMSGAFNFAFFLLDYDLVARFLFKHSPCTGFSFVAIERKE